MSRLTRRTFLTVSGGLLGGAAAGTTVTAAERTDRFVVDTSGLSREDVESGAFDVVHDLSAVDLAVVEGRAGDVKKVTRSFESDVELRLGLPEMVDAAPESATDEPGYEYQWDKQEQHIPEVHEISRGEGTRVAIVDSGVAAGHPDLERAVNRDLSRNFTGDGYGAGGPFGGDHGTHVAGIVAADDRNEAGVVGTAPDAEIVDCRVFSAEGGASFGDILAAIVHSAEVGCDVANLSLGAYPVSRKELGSFYGKSLNRTMTYANAAGTLLVVSAGNDGADLQHDGNLISLPNEGAQALAVSGTGPIGFGWDAGDAEAPAYAPAFYTNYGTNAIDLAAPGGNADEGAIGSDDVPWHLDLVYSTVAEPVYDEDEETVVDVEYGYGWKAGTSMAAPQVAGAAALVKSVDPNANANQVESKLARTAEVPDGYDKTYYGSGFVDPLAAVRR
ncbi:S8 family peptidase [Halegenticoccus tardaugens]|uniref:S8 family peptidase n=1 Tax=Halegenticoccus tardaugens TaxID=2071624 RepID=UPI00100AF427|nr:S8 family serine peptidase [Halegenticoccus tardaugens]